MISRLAAESLWASCIKLKKIFGLWLFIFISSEKPFLNDVFWKFLTDRLFVCQWGSFCYCWQTFCLSVTPKICHWQTKSLSLDQKSLFDRLFVCQLHTFGHWQTFLSVSGTLLASLTDKKSVSGTFLHALTDKKSVKDQKKWKKTVEDFYCWQTFCLSVVPKS